MEDQLLLFITGAAVLMGLAVIIGAMMSKRKPPYDDGGHKHSYEPDGKGGWKCTCQQQ